MRLSALLVAVVAGPAFAGQRTFDFLGDYGCTVSEASRDALANAGFLEPYTNAIIDDAFASGLATQQGEYVVLDASICTIRLPVIESRWSAESPEVQAIAPYTRDIFEYEGEIDVSEGCFLNDGITLFTKLEGGDEEAGFSDYMAFLGANIISGEARFYATTPLATPRGFQLTTGDCARAPNIPAIVENQPFVETAFSGWVRRVAAETPCGEDLTWRNLQIGAKLQGVDIDAIDEDTMVFNAWLGFEFQIIAMSAGWYEGMSATQKGTPRPPLCHYPS